MSDEAVSRDDTFRAFTEGLARQIRSEERKRLWRLVTGVGLCLLVLFALLIQGRHSDNDLRLKLRDQCEARNVILELQRDLYRKMVILDGTNEQRRIAWSTILGGLPQNKNCEDFMH